MIQDHEQETGCQECGELTNPEDRKRAEDVARVLYDACLLRDSVVMEQSAFGNLDYPRQVADIIEAAISAFAEEVRRGVWAEVVKIAQRREDEIRNQSDMDIDAKLYRCDEARRLWLVFRDAAIRNEGEE